MWCERICHFPFDPLLAFIPPLTITIIITIVINAFEPTVLGLALPVQGSFVNNAIVCFIFIEITVQMPQA